MNQYVLPVIIELAFKNAKKKRKKCVSLVLLLKNDRN